jgi:hypothetical protein
MSEDDLSQISVGASYTVSVYATARNGSWGGGIRFMVAFK